MVFALATCLLGGCVETRVVRSSSLLGGLPGAEGGVQVDAPDPGAGSSWDQILTSFDDPDADPNARWEPVEGTHLRAQSQTGELLLISTTPSHVMYHLTQTLRNGELDLLVDQVLSERTKSAYASQGRDPMDAARYLKENEEHITDLFAAIPLGEQTPGVFMESLGDNAFRLSAPPALVPDLKYRYFDVVIERGSFRLLRVS